MTKHLTEAVTTIYNDGDYGFEVQPEFPVKVQAFYAPKMCLIARVTPEEMERVGFKNPKFKPHETTEGPYFLFNLGSEAILEEQ